VERAPVMVGYPTGDEAGQHVRRAPQYGGQPVTNIRNIASPHRHGRLGVGSRCVVPATSFCEYADTKPRKTPTWFALKEPPR
jgi:putative SOS response-associated peptidase YedK